MFKQSKVPSPTPANPPQSPCLLLPSPFFILPSSASLILLRRNVSTRMTVVNYFVDPDVDLDRTVGSARSARRRGSWSRRRRARSSGPAEWNPAARAGWTEPRPRRSCPGSPRTCSSARPALLLPPRLTLHGSQSEPAASASKKGAPRPSLRSPAGPAGARSGWRPFELCTPSVSCQIDCPASPAFRGRPRPGIIEGVGTLLRAHVRAQPQA